MEFQNPYSKKSPKQLEDKLEIPCQLSNDSPAIPEKINDNPLSPISSSTLIDKILSERQALLKGTIADILSSIQERKHLLTEIISGIEKRECEILSMISHLDPFVYYSMEIDDQRIALEKELTNLKKQKGDHIIQNFRDVVMLKKDLREFFLEYAAMRQWDLSGF